MIQAKTLDGERKADGIVSGGFFRPIHMRPRYDDVAEMLVAALQWVVGQIHESTSKEAISKLQ
jgi:hypothetical protein